MLLSKASLVLSGSERSLLQYVQCAGDSPMATAARCPQPCDPVCVRGHAITLMPARANVEILPHQRGSRGPLPRRDYIRCLRHVRNKAQSSCHTHTHTILNPLNWRMKEWGRLGIEVALFVRPDSRSWSQFNNIWGNSQHENVWERLE